MSTIECGRHLLTAVRHETCQRASLVRNMPSKWAEASRSSSERVLETSVKEAQLREATITGGVELSEGQEGVFM